MPISGKPRITFATCNAAGCRVTEIAGRSRSRNAPVNRTRLLTKVGGRLSHQNLPGGSCIGILQKTRKSTARKRQLLLQIVSSPTRRSRRISRDCTAFLLILDDVIFRLVVTISENWLDKCVRRPVCDFTFCLGPVPRFLNLRHTS